MSEEFGYVAAAHGEIRLPNGAILDPVLEYTHFDDDGAGDAASKNLNVRFTFPL